MENQPKNWSKSPKTHVCLVSGDAIPMLTPVIDKTIPSDNLVLVYFNRDESALKYITAIAQSRGYACQHWPLPESEHTDEIKLALMQVFEQLDKSDNELWLNATCEYLHLSLAAFEVARTYQVPTFVVEPNQDALYWLSPEQWPNARISNHIQTEGVFRAEGHSMSALRRFCLFRFIEITGKKSGVNKPVC